MKASTKKTPQPSPASHSAVLNLLGQESTTTPPFVGTPERVSALRGACLVRDRHRCVITRRFDKKEAAERLRAAGSRGIPAQDDDGNPLDNGVDFEHLEVAHILPHSLTRTNSSSKLVWITFRTRINAGPLLTISAFLGYIQDCGACHS